VFAFNLVEAEPGNLKERLSQKQWESLLQYVIIGTDQEVSWYFQTLIQDLSEGELELEREYRQRMGIAPLVEADESL